MPPSDQTPSPSPRRYLLTLLAILTASILLIAALALLYASNKPAPPDFLNPKLTAAYTNLLAIAADITGDLNSTNRTAFVAQNQSALTALHRAIQHPIEAPQTYHPFAAPASRLTHALIAEGKYAEDQKRYRDAANIYLDTFRLGERLEHGPLLKPIVGSTAQRMALLRLNPLIPNLNNQDLADLAPSLQTFNRDRITYDEIIRRNPYYTPTANVIETLRLQLSTDFKKFKKNLKQKHLQLRAETEITAATMAALRYTRENQTPLTNLQSLIPTYLKTIPLDPYSQSPLLLLPSTNPIPTIYSIGPNLRDDQSNADDLIAPTQ